MRVSRHLSPTSPCAGFSTISIFSIPLIVFAAFSMLVIAAQIAALDPLMVTCASTIMVCLPASLSSGCGRRKRCSRVHADRVAEWIGDESNRARTIGQVEREAGRNGSTQLLRLPAACRKVVHLDVD